MKSQYGVNYLIFVNQHSKMLEWTQNFLNQIPIYFKTSSNELDTEKQRISQWFVMGLGDILFSIQGASNER